VETLKTYYKLTKPGIIKGNLLTAAAGYLFGAHGSIDVVTFAAVLIGVVFVIGAGCVFNNVIDRGIDSKMKRTKNRALVTGSVTPKNAYIFGTLLALIGFTTLILGTNALTVLIGVLALLLYVVVYGYAKRVSVHGTLVGALPGAASLLAGYTAATGELTATAALLFAIMVIWQMPHFYAIAIYRLQEYKAAGLPVLSVTKGVAATRLQIFVYIVAFAVSVLMLPIFGYASLSFGLVMGLTSLFWLRIAARGFTAKDTDAWARKVFGVSLLVLLIFSFMLSIDSFLP
jgi:heme o synthase